jgi:osmotically inducible protein OsmC
MEGVMAVRSADAEWRGNLNDGSGKMRFGSGAYEGAFDFKSRMGEGRGTNPEELIGAALAGCYSMALSAGLAGAGLAPESVRTSAKVHFDKKDAGWTIHTIELDTEAKVPGLAAADFQKRAEDTKKNCPVSRALTGVDIKLNARLV